MSRQLFLSLGRCSSIRTEAALPATSLAASSDPLTCESRFLDVKFTAQVEEDLVVDDCLQAQTRQLLPFSVQQRPSQSPQCLIFVKERRERRRFQIALQGLNSSAVPLRCMLEEFGRELRPLL